MTEGGVGFCCVTGTVHEGSYKGTVGAVAGLPTYIAKPSSSTTTKEGIIVIVPDVFGWDFINNRLLADEYAERSGRVVYLPDFMFGNTSLPLFSSFVLI
jgi:dienelactone hydrolase